VRGGVVPVVRTEPDRPSVRNDAPWFDPKQAGAGHGGVGCDSDPRVGFTGRELLKITAPSEK